MNSLDESRIIARESIKIDINDSIINEMQPRNHTPSDIDYQSMQPYFSWITTDVIKQTFKNSTQYGFMPSSDCGNIFKRWRAPDPAMNVHRLQDDLLTDKISSNTPALDGSFTDAQVFFGRKSHILHVPAAPRRCCPRCT